MILDPKTHTYQFWMWSGSNHKTCHHLGATNFESNWTIITKLVHPLEFVNFDKNKFVLSDPEIPHILTFNPIGPQKNVCHLEFVNYIKKSEPKITHIPVLNKIRHIGAHILIFSKKKSNTLSLELWSPANIKLIGKLVRQNSLPPE